MNPIQRVGFAIRQNADAYVFHTCKMNCVVTVMFTHAGICIYKNPEFLKQSRLLGSAVSANLGADFKIFLARCCCIVSLLLNQRPGSLKRQNPVNGFVSKSDFC